MRTGGEQIFKIDQEKQASTSIDRKDKIEIELPLSTSP
jgi:hypothetical protein